MKRFIQLFSFLGLALCFCAAAANAQSEYAAEVEFPFAFSAGGRSYAAGRYGIKINRNETGTATVILDDFRNGRVQIIVARRNGHSSSADVSLVFEKDGEDRVLSRVLTPSGGFDIYKASNQTRIASAVDLKRRYKPGVVHVNDLD